MAYLDQLLFGYYPYVCLSVFLVGSLIRFDRDQYSWRSGSSQMLRNRQMRLGSNLFHVGIILLFFGHFFGMLTPVEVFHALGIGAPAKQLLAVVAGGIFGTICFIGMTLLVHRRLFDPRIRATSSRRDILILLLLYVQLILGLFTIPVSLSHPDGGQMLAFMAWARAIVTFQGGAADLVADANLIFKLHITLGLTVFLVFPFTRLVHVWSVPYEYLFRSYQVVRRRS